MKDAPRRTVRQVAIADHLWDALEEMARQMGAEREALVNQALFTFARLNGFLDVPRPEAAAAPARARPRREERPLAAAEPTPPVPDVGEQARETAEELERMARAPEAPAADAAPPARERPGPDAETGAGAYVLNEAGDVEKVARDRFVIGRGTHCDLVIRSGKVSREHAVIVREGADYYLEDLDSSNGTYVNKQRIKRRKLQDGDEFLICNERLRVVLR